MASKWDIYSVERTVVVGNDPEFADMDNPRGEVFDEVYTIEATNDEGDRKVLTSISFLEENEALHFVRTLDKDSPDTGDDWEYTSPIYGSYAYVADWENQERDLDKLDREAEERRYG